MNVKVGDTIVTYHRSYFPEGIMIGTVISVDKNTPDDFLAIKVRLSTQFGSLSHVYIVNNVLKEEQQALEAEEKNDR